MSTKIFVNLPVKDLDRTKDFFAKLGFKYNPQFTDQKAACMIISEENYAMLLKEDFFKTFTQKSLADARKTTETIVSLSAESREKVDEMVDKALAAGGTISGKTQDLDYMYERGFQDLDGHLWEIIYMDPKTIQPTA